MSKRIIFHIPVQLDRSHASASQIRPLKIIAAFQNIGYKVDIVEGTAKMRQSQIGEIKKNIRNGIKYDFVYSESSTMPTLLTESHHLPTHPCLDFGFFRFCKKNNIPIGLFYRDIYWCFINKNKDFKQRVAKFFYKYDLKQYEKYIDVLFLPTMDMFEHIPFSFHKEVVELPPGCDLQQPPDPAPHSVLSMLYIGGVGGTYSLKLFMKALSAISGIQLTICCRKDEWDSLEEEYRKLSDAPNITVVHKKGEELIPLYEQADMFSMLYETSSLYLSFAAPFKLFEAIGYGKPLIGYRKNWSGKFIEKNGVGLVCDNTPEDVAKALNALCDDKDLLQQYKSRLSNIAPQHTWESRARKVAEVLTKNVTV